MRALLPILLLGVLCGCQSRRTTVRVLPGAPIIHKHVHERQAPTLAQPAARPAPVAPATIAPAPAPQAAPPCDDAPC